MTVVHRSFLHLAAGAAALPAASRLAWAQSYPPREITMIVRFSAGGPAKHDQDHRHQDGLMQF